MGALCEVKLWGLCVRSSCGSGCVLFICQDVATVNVMIGSTTFKRTVNRDLPCYPLSRFRYTGSVFRIT